MSIQFSDILKHNNLLYPIVDINDVKGGLRSIATFSSTALVSEYASIPEKYRSGYSLLLETSTGTIYYLAGNDATNKFDWSPVGIGGNGFGVTNSIPKWVSSSILGNSNITDNGDTIIINGNLQVIGTTSTISTENLLVKDPIILLAGSQSGTPTYDAGLFVNRGSLDTQAFIWDESEKEFKFITTTSGATVSGDVIIGAYSSVRTGVLRVGTQSINSNDRFVVSSSTGSVSLVVNNNGNVGIGLTVPNCALEINGHKTYTLPDTEGASGEIVFFGTASTALDAGFIYQFTTTGVWEKADFTTESTAKGLLAISLGKSVSDGLLIKGYAKFDYSPYGTMTLGSTLYLWENGVFNSTPATNPGEVVRVIGYCIDEPPLSVDKFQAGTLYFCPDTTWIELS